VIEERKSMKEIQNTAPRERRPPGVCGTTSDHDYYIQHLLIVGNIYVEGHPIIFECAS
jgi:hypothetical protein